MKNSKVSRFNSASIIREIFAILFWLYLIIKIFIFDIDIFLINQLFPGYGWVIDWKFVILIGILAVIAIFTRNVILWIFYIAFYPFILLLWKIPSLIFKKKSWNFAFALVDSIISFFRSIKYNIITFAFFLVSFASILIFPYSIILWFAITINAIILFIVYVRRFIQIFKPSNAYQFIVKTFAFIKKTWGPSFSMDKSIKNLPVERMDTKQLETRNSNLQLAVLFNRVSLFTARKLKDYQNSGLNVVSYVLTLLLLIFLTTLSFAAINYGLFKIESDQFNFSASPNFFTFFYYSFYRLISSSIPEIIPASIASQIASMIESFFALFLIAIFVSLLLSTKNQRHVEQLNQVIREIESHGKNMEILIKDQYKINSINDAMAELEKMKAALIKFIYKISESIG